MRKLFPLLIIIQFCNFAKAQNVGIGTSTPQAALDVSSSTQGFLPPRLTISQRDDIITPVAGLVIFCSDCDELQVYNGTIWKNMKGMAACTAPVPLSITICSQIWMLKNLDVSTYRNGDPIPQVTSQSTWMSLTTGAWCYYNNDSANNAATYGKLYNWYAVNDPRGLAPAGWHIPSDTEWTTLSNCLGGDELAGGSMKEIGYTHWQSPNNGATNSSGFSGLPGGSRHYNGLDYTFQGLVGLWWSSTVDNPGTAKMCYLYNEDDNLTRAYYYLDTGFSVRCVKD